MSRAIKRDITVLSAMDAGSKEEQASVFFLIVTDRSKGHTLVILKPEMTFSGVKPLYYALEKSLEKS